MKIGSQHVYKIWRSLVEYRNCVVEICATAVTGGDYLYAMVAAGGVGGEVPAVQVSPGDCDAVLAADTRLSDARPALGRARILLKDEHNYC